MKWRTRQRTDTQIITELKTVQAQLADALIILHAFEQRVNNLADQHHQEQQFRTRDP